MGTGRSWNGALRLAAASRCRLVLSKLGLVHSSRSLRLRHPTHSLLQKFDVERSLAYSLLRRLFKPPPTSIVLDDRSYRIVASHLSGPLLLSIPNWDRLPLRALAIDRANVEQLRVEGFGISTVHVEFFEIPLSR